MAKLFIHFCLEADYVIWLNAMAKEQKTTRSHIIRRCIYEAKAKTDMRSMKP